jgi:hypothetical protein
MDVLLSGQPEQNLAVYYDNGRGWQRLETTLDMRHNFASAPLPGAGLYALMSGFQITLPARGWNLVAYPLDSTLPVTEGLASLEGAYTTVFGYDASDPRDPWAVYDTRLAKLFPWVNDLRQLHPGRGYWIRATRPVTWFVTDGAATAADTMRLPQPPATFYGTVRASTGFTPTEGLTVTASVAGVVCGRGETRRVEGEVVYVVDVEAAGSGETAGCGEPGRQVTFAVGEQPLATAASWDNTDLHALSLSVDGPHLYLPTIQDSSSAGLSAEWMRQYLPLIEP